MSDSNIPPDDFSATTPNIKVPKKDSNDFSSQPANDWEKTNYNYSPKDLGKDEWNKTAYNAPKSPPNQSSDFDKTNYSAQPPAKDADWGVTQANINLPGNRPNQYDNPVYEDYGSKQSGYEKTSLAINLPKNEEPKYQEPKYQEPKYQEPPKKKAAEPKKDERKKGGVPGWLWASAGLLGMFLFAAVVLGGVYFLFLGKTGFEVIVKGVPTGSDVLVDGSFWGVSDSDGTIRLKTLRAGQTKTIAIKNPAFKCEDIVIQAERAKNGGEPIQENARCSSTGTGNTGPKQTGPVGEAPKECLEIKPGEYEKAAKCAYDELDKLEAAEKNGKMFTVEQLLFAMNLYVVNFDKNKAIIRPVDRKFLERASGFMKKLPANTVIEVGGHTDSDGTDAKNQPLSESRAAAVRNALVLEFKINPNMLRTKGYGSSQPRESGTSEEAKFRNRRIEYKAIS